KNKLLHLISENNAKIKEADEKLNQEKEESKKQLQGILCENDAKIKKMDEKLNKEKEEFKKQLNQKDFQLENKTNDIKKINKSLSEKDDKIKKIIKEKTDIVKKHESEIR